MKNFFKKNLLSLQPCLLSVVFVYLFMFFKMLFFNSIYPDSYLYFKSEDIYWILKMGSWIINNAQIPHFNVLGGQFSELNSLSWVCYQWLFSLIMATTNNLLGIKGLIYIYSVFYLFTISLLGYMLYLRGFKLFPEIAIAVAISSQYLYSIIDLRPGIFTIIGCAFLSIIFQFLERKRFLWLSLPVLFLLWANLHLGFVFGILWLAVEMTVLAISKKTILPIGLLILCILTTGINPNGFYLYKYLYALGNSPYMNMNIQELLPFSFAFNYESFCMILLLLSSFYAFNSAKIRISEKIMFLLSLILTLISARHISYTIVFMPLIYSTAIEKLINSFGKEVDFFKQRSEQKINLPLYFLVCGLIGLIFCLNKSYELPKLPKYLTPAFIEYVNENPLNSPVLSNPAVGSELLYYTKARSYLDSRFDMYGDKYVEKYMELFSLHGCWNDKLKKNKIKYLLYDSKTDYEKENNPFDNLKENFELYGWKVLYRDKNILLLGT